jgi:hypothetical protein
MKNIVEPQWQIHLAGALCGFMVKLMIDLKKSENTTLMQDKLLDLLMHYNLALSTQIKA